MLGRRLDRYIGLFFVWHFVLSLVAIVLLYVIIDTFAKLENFLEQDTILAFLRWIVVYHAYQVPALLTQFFPLVTLLAGVLAISRLARYNELNAIKAVGISLNRALAPVLLISLAIGGLAAANQELLVPLLAPGTVEVRSDGSKKETYKDLASYDRAAKATIWVRQLEYSMPGFAVTGLEAHPTGPPASGRGPDALRIRNATGIWVERSIFLTGGEAQDPQGAWKPFQYKSLTTKESATTYPMPRKPEPVAPVRLEGDRLGTPVAIAFSSWERKGSLRLMVDAQLTAPLRGQDAQAPIAIQAALWREEPRVWLGRARTYYVTETKRDEILYDGDPLPFAVPPSDLIKSEADPTLKSFRELLTYRDSPPALRQKLLVVLHSRIAFPFASFVLLLVAIPLLFQQEGGKSTWVGMGLALLVSMCFYFVNYIAQLSGQSPNGLLAGLPALAAWLPILLFGIVGVALMRTMET